MNIDNIRDSTVDFMSGWSNRLHRLFIPGPTGAYNVVQTERQADISIPSPSVVVIDSVRIKGAGQVEIACNGNAYTIATLGGFVVPLIVTLRYSFDNGTTWRYFWTTSSTTEVMQTKTNNFEPFYWKETAYMKTSDMLVQAIAYLTAMPDGGGAGHVSAHCIFVSGNIVKG